MIFAAVMASVVIASGILPPAAAQEENATEQKYTRVAAKASPVEPEALRILRKMTDYLGGLQQFSVETGNMLEDVMMSGQKIQYDFSARVVIQRPNKLRAERRAYQFKQLLVYNGKVLTISNHEDKYFATSDAPDNIDDMLHFARDTLDIVPPTGDMVFTNAFDLLTASVTSGQVIGKSLIAGVVCDHLAFAGPLVDWQIWIADGDKPLPYKYVLTTKDDPVHPQFIVLMSNWNIAPKVNESMFEFTPPRGAMRTEFIRMETDPAKMR
jgi:hypothetical protein